VSPQSQSRNVRRLLFSATGLKAGFAARSKKAVAARPSLCSGPEGCGPIVPGLSTIIEIAMGAVRSAKGNS